MATPLAFGGSVPRRQEVGLGMASPSLGSWKEIASFFAKTTRTVQRWERTENLPVYRHVHGKGSTVYAFESELTAWRAARSRNRDQGILRGRATSRRLCLAVLPLVDLSAKHQLHDFEDALTYERVVQLARLAFTPAYRSNLPSMAFVIRPNERNGGKNKKNVQGTSTPRRK